MTDPSPFAWQPHPDAWLLLVVVLGGYLYALSAWGPRHAPGRRAATSRQRACFFAGAAVMWFASDWPIHGLAEDYLFSVHMVQHMLYMYVAAPLLLLGTPGWLLRRLLRPAPVFAIARVITQPLLALAAVNGYILFTHWPAVVTIAVEVPAVHFLLHVLLMGVSFIMWWPVLSPLPELPHLSYPAGIGYLFAHSILPTVPASFLTFSSAPLYEVYAQATQLATWLDPVQDQQIAGLLMKLGGGLLLWGVIAVLFFRWATEETSGAPDALYWRDLEPDVTIPDTERGATP